MPDLSLQSSASKTFAILYAPGPRWIAGRSLAEQSLVAHRAYLIHWTERGMVESWGPFSDSSGGMVILRAETTTDVDTFIAADPAVIDGVFTAQARQWLVALRKQSVRK